LIAFYVADRWGRKVCSINWSEVSNLKSCTDLVISLPYSLRLLSQWLVLLFKLHQVGICMTLLTGKQDYLLTESRNALYVGRLVAGFGVGAASMLTPLYVSENAPRAIRGGLTGLYQLFIATGKS
jgi:MFS family permease